MLHRISTAFHKLGKFLVSPQGLFLITIFTLACIIRPEIAAIAAAVGAMIFMIAAYVGAAVAMIGIYAVAIAAMLAIFPGCLILPFWLAGRNRRKLEARIAQLEAKEKPPT